MTSVKLMENIFWVGAVDWNIRNFHGFTYSTHRGTTYNAYLIINDRIALADSVYGPLARAPTFSLLISKTLSLTDSGARAHNI